MKSPERNGGLTRLCGFLALTGASPFQGKKLSIQDPQVTHSIADKNNQYTIYNRNRKEFYLSQTEDDSPGNSLPDNSEELLRRSMVFSATVLCLVRTKYIK